MVAFATPTSSEGEINMLTLSGYCYVGRTQPHSHIIDLKLATLIGSVSRGGQASSIAAGSREYQTSCPLMIKWDGNAPRPFSYFLCGRFFDEEVIHLAII
jgi:hypothetical protein